MSQENEPSHSENFPSHRGKIVPMPKFFARGLQKSVGRHDMFVIGRENSPTSKKKIGTIGKKRLEIGEILAAVQEIFLTVR